MLFSIPGFLFHLLPKIKNLLINILTDILIGILNFNEN